MANPLLSRVAPDILARKAQAFEIVENLSTFERLAAVVAEDMARLDAGQVPAEWRKREVEVRLEFGWADARERLPRVTGSVATTVPLQCQRCLDCCDIRLEAALDLLLVASDETGAIFSDAPYARP